MTKVSWRRARTGWRQVPARNLGGALDGPNVLLRLEAPGGADCQDCATIHLVRKLDQPQPRRTGS